MSANHVAARAFFPPSRLALTNQNAEDSLRLYIKQRDRSVGFSEDERSSRVLILLRAGTVFVRTPTAAQVWTSSHSFNHAKYFLKCMFIVCTVYLLYSHIFLSASDGYYLCCLNYLCIYLFNVF